MRSTGSCQLLPIGGGPASEADRELSPRMQVLSFLKADLKAELRCPEKSAFLVAFDGYRECHGMGDSCSPRCKANLAGIKAADGADGTCMASLLDLGMGNYHLYQAYYEIMLVTGALASFPEVDPAAACPRTWTMPLDIAEIADVSVCYDCSSGACVKCAGMTGQCTDTGTPASAFTASGAGAYTTPGGASSVELNYDRLVCIPNLATVAAQGEPDMGETIMQLLSEDH